MNKAYVLLTVNCLKEKKKQVMCGCLTWYIMNILIFVIETRHPKIL